MNAYCPHPARVIYLADDLRRMCWWCNAELPDSIPDGGEETQQVCGCWRDPFVFGHYHTAEVA